MNKTFVGGTVTNNSYVDFGGGTIDVKANATLLGNPAGPNQFADGLALFDGPWTITLDGSIGGLNNRGGIALVGVGGATVSKITIGATGSIAAHGGGDFGSAGIELQNAANVFNSGSIYANGTGISAEDGFFGQHDFTITNKAGATIEGGSYGVFHDSGTVMTLNNAGTITGGKDAIWALDQAVITNSGTIDGAVYLGNLADKLTNTGTIHGEIFMGAGDDKFVGGGSAELLRDGDGSDNVKLAGGDDIYLAVDKFGGDGTDTVDGGAGNDNYSALNSTGQVFINLDSVVHNGLAAHTATGTDIGTDTLTSFEFIVGSNHEDSIFGGSAAETLNGMGGNDELYGGGGNDTLNGGANHDQLVGGLGADILTGGAADDSFIFLTTKDSGITAATRDTITDFAVGIDRIDLNAIDVDPNTAGDQAFSWHGLDKNGGHTFNHLAGELHAWWQGSQTFVEGDVNGDGKADFSIALDGHINLTANDFAL